MIIYLMWAPAPRVIYRMGVIQNEKELKCGIEMIDGVKVIIA